MNNYRLDLATRMPAYKEFKETRYRRALQGDCA